MSTTAWDCALCNIPHITRPFYESQSLPSGLYVRCCDLGKLMTATDMQYAADAWLDREIAERAKRGVR